MTLEEAFKCVGASIIASMQEGEALLAHKIDKHIGLDNDEKVAFYFIHLFYSEREDEDGFIDRFVGNICPASKEAVNRIPCAVKAIEYLKAKGWRIKIGDYPGYGKQVIASFPDGKRCYHSKWKWDT